MMAGPGRSQFSYVNDNTIDIPVNENWILQGTAVDGVPVILPARLKSGYAYPYPGVMSQANIVMRYARFSAQQATLDPYEQERTHSIALPTRLGGALDYTGGWGATIRIEHCVFDHMLATSGGALFIDGQMDEWARQPQRTPEQIDQELTVTVIISDTLFWECEAIWCGGAARLVDVYPLNLTMTDNQFLDNYAVVSDLNWAVYSRVFDQDANGAMITGLQGNSHIHLKRNELSKITPIKNGRFEQSPIAMLNFPGRKNTP